MCEKNKKPLEAAELTDDQLEQAAGGGNESTICACCLQELGTNESCDYCKTYNNKNKAKRHCEKCGDVLHELRFDGWYCTVCGSRYGLDVMMFF
ncbi:MAG: hypothetical protein IJX84_11240 [Clostridia bacterium]|nr:hypothetical protein [Clostridia bacterium]